MPVFHSHYTGSAKLYCANCTLYSRQSSISICIRYLVFPFPIWIYIEESTFRNHWCSHARFQFAHTRQTVFRCEWNAKMFDKKKKKRPTRHIEITFRWLLCCFYIYRSGFLFSPWAFFFWIGNKQTAKAYFFLFDLPFSRVHLLISLSGWVIEIRQCVVLANFSLISMRVCV